MQKTLLGPGAYEPEAGDSDHLRYSVAVTTDHGSHVRVVFSGVAWPEGDLEEQTRTVLDFVERALADVGGSLDDVLTLRWYVHEDYLSRETQARINDVRGEFFEPPHYPASTMVGVASLLEEGMAFELELEAEVPADDWTTTAFVGEDHEEVPGETVREMLSDERAAADGASDEDDAPDQDGDVRDEDGDTRDQGQDSFDQNGDAGGE